MSASSIAQAAAFSDSEHADDGSWAPTTAEESPWHTARVLAAARADRPLSFRKSLADEICNTLGARGLAPERTNGTSFYLAASGEKTCSVQIHENGIAVCVLSMRDSSNSAWIIEKGISRLKIILRLLKLSRKLSETSEDVPF